MKNAQHKRLFLAGIVFIVIIGLGLWIFSTARQSQSHAKIPVGLKQIKAFTPYYFTDGHIPYGFRLMPNGLTYEEGILFIQLASPDGGEVVLTQQPMPNDFATAENVIGDEQIKGADGKATLSHREGQKIVTMIPSNKNTLILLTAPANISSDTLSDLARALRKIDYY